MLQFLLITTDQKKNVKQFAKQHVHISSGRPTRCELKQFISYLAKFVMNFTKQFIHQHNVHTTGIM